MTNTSQVLILEVRGGIVQIAEYLTITKSITIIPFNNRSSRIITTDRFANPRLNNISFYYHFQFVEDNEINKDSIVVEDMNGEPLTVDSVLVKSSVNKTNNQYKIDVESYTITIEPRKTYWVSISYTTSDYIEKEKSTYTLNKWISFPAESASIKVKIPLTNFISPSINILNIQSVTPEPVSIYNEDKYKILLWDEPATDILNVLLFEVTIKYH